MGWQREGGETEVGEEGVVAVEFEKRLELEKQRRGI
jgi:hypothetical protein